MGEIIVKMYDVITQRAGYEGRLKFAEKIGIPRNKAAQIEDTPDWWPNAPKRPVPSSVKISMFI